MTVLEKVDLLQKAPIFSEVRTESLARIAAIAHEADFEKRQVLFRENTAADTLFVVLEGEVVLLSDGREEKKLASPQVVGALPVLSGEPHPQSAMTTQASRLLEIDQQELFDAMAEDFNITRGIVRALVRLATSGA